ncbi:unnamed protein product [Chondrus crispus]|uniref:Uncharacterized protein n=1 Tax=Chondrus crispus TaxID=2769 RepID=R7QMI4_CHOCR|nr:unnamed protein product [Chondrus crispus]CDF38691.1 unnamed protein product [Chondrus crispus]|eukprot:XP_005718596.1 unnamed protein product [Chondrus crispus]
MSFGTNAVRSGHRRTQRPSTHRNKGASTNSFPKSRTVDSSREDNPSATPFEKHERPEKLFTRETENQRLSRQRNDSPVFNSDSPHAGMWPEVDHSVNNLDTRTAEGVWVAQKPCAHKLEVWQSRDDCGNAFERMNLEPDPVPIAAGCSKKCGITSMPTEERDNTRILRRKFNYAAAVATGTSHAKVEQEVTASIERAGLADVAHGKEPALMVAPAVDRSQVSSVNKALSEELHATDENDDESPRVRAEARISKPAIYDSTMDEASNPCVVDQASRISTTSQELKLGTPSIVQGVWASRSDRVSEDVSRIEGAQAPQLGSVESSSGLKVGGGVGESLSLQFGSLGLNGLEGVNWSASGKSSESVSAVTEGDDSCIVGDPSVTTHGSASNAPSNTPGAVSVVSRSVHAAIGSPADRKADKLLPNSASVPVSSPSGSKSARSGVFPVLPVAPAGSYATANYGPPYLIPQVHGYSPAIGSFESSGDAGSARSLKAGPPGSLSLNDPVSLSGLASGNGKFAGIPGLGDLPAVPSVPGATRKDSLHEIADIDDTCGLSSSGLPAGIDPLGAPYMLPGYPSIQYPVYAFPNAPYPAPPAMTAAGPNQFPYPHAGQVGPAQSSRGGFGFDDGSVTLGRTRSSSGMGESVYTPGAYLPSSHSNTQKVSSEASYKHMRAPPPTGSSLGPLGVGGGFVHGVAYSEYSPTTGGAGTNTFVGNNGTNMGWNGREGLSGRTENASGSRPVSHAGSQASALYPNGPGGAPAGYWALQGGYYP